MNSRDGQESENTLLSCTQEYDNQRSVNSQWRRYGSISETNISPKETVPTQPTPIQTSTWMYRFGIVQITLSVVLILWCLGIKLYGVNYAAVYVTAAGSIFPIIPAAVAIRGSKDVVRYHNYVIACFVLSLLSNIFLVLVVVTIIFDWTNANFECDNCLTLEKKCSVSECSFTTNRIFLPMTILVAFQFVVNICQDRKCTEILGWCSNCSPRYDYPWYYNYYYWNQYTPQSQRFHTYF